MNKYNPTVSNQYMQNTNMNKNTEQNSNKGSGDQNAAEQSERRKHTQPYYGCDTLEAGCKRLQAEGKLPAEEGSVSAITADSDSFRERMVRDTEPSDEWKKLSRAVANEMHKKLGRIPGSENIPALQSSTPNQHPKASAPETRINPFTGNPDYPGPITAAYRKMYLPPSNTMQNTKGKSRITKSKRESGWRLMIGNRIVAYYDSYSEARAALNDAMNSSAIDFVPVQKINQNQ